MGRRASLGGERHTTACMAGQDERGPVLAVKPSEPTHQRLHHQLAAARSSLGWAVGWYPSSPPCRCPYPAPRGAGYVLFQARTLRMDTAALLSVLPDGQLKSVSTGKRRGGGLVRGGGTV
jgi:hypothetical protein